MLIQTMVESSTSMDLSNLVCSDAEWIALPGNEPVLDDNGDLQPVPRPGLQIWRIMLHGLLIQQRIRTLRFFGRLYIRTLTDIYC